MHSISTIIKSLLCVLNRDKNKWKPADETAQKRYKSDICDQCGAIIIHYHKVTNVVLFFAVISYTNFMNRNQSSNFPCKSITATFLYPPYHINILWNVQPVNRVMQSSNCCHWEASQRVIGTLQTVPRLRTTRNSAVKTYKKNVNNEKNKWYPRYVVSLHLISCPSCLINGDAKIDLQILFLLSVW